MSDLYIQLEQSKKIKSGKQIYFFPGLQGMMIYTQFCLEDLYKLVA